MMYGLPESFDLFFVTSVSGRETADTDDERTTYVHKTNGLNIIMSNTHSYAQTTGMQAGMDIKFHEIDVKTIFH